MRATSTESTACRCWTMKNTPGANLLECPVHMPCACGCHRARHLLGIGVCEPYEGSRCHGCPEYRPAKLRPFSELRDDELDKYDAPRLRSEYAAFRAHHIEETTVLHARKLLPTGRLKDNPLTQSGVDEGQRFYGHMLSTRGIEATEQICKVCSGYGYRMYSNTSGWRGGMGGAAMTSDTCDHCWGSGNCERPWLNLREIDVKNRELIAERAVDALARSCAAYPGISTSMQKPIREIIEHLDLIQRKRKVDFWAKSLASGLTNLLRRAIGDPEKNER